MALKKKKESVDEAPAPFVRFYFEEGYLGMFHGEKSILSDFKMKDGIDRNNLLIAINILAKHL